MDKTYNTVSGFQDYAKANGRGEIYTSSDTTTIASANGGETAASTGITYDGLSGTISAGDYIRIANEIIYVVSLSTTELTVTRGQLGSTAAIIANDAVITVQDFSTIIQILLMATQNIELLHGQYRASTTEELYYYTDTMLIQFANELCLHLYSVWSQITVARNIAAITTGSFQDANLTVGSVREIIFPGYLKAKIKSYLANYYEIGSNRLGRA